MKIAKQTQTYRYRKQTGGYQREEEGGKWWDGGRRLRGRQATVYKIYRLQGCIAQGNIAIILW